MKYYIGFQQMYNFEKKTGKNLFSVVEGLSDGAELSIEDLLALAEVALEKYQPEVKNGIGDYLDERECSLQDVIEGIAEAIQNSTVLPKSSEIFINSSTFTSSFKLLYKPITLAFLYSSNLSILSIIILDLTSLSKISFLISLYLILSSFLFILVS